MMMNAREFATLKQRLEELDGSRQPQAAGKAAIRFADVAPALLGLPDALKSAKAAGDPVTPAEFDALVEDVQLLYRTLKALGVAMKAKRTP